MNYLNSSNLLGSKHISFITSQVLTSTLYPDNLKLDPHIIKKKDGVEYKHKGKPTTRSTLLHI
jgi:hypothetical protein